MRAPVLCLLVLLAAIASAGCALPAYLDCTARLASVSWTQPGLYDTLKHPPLRLGVVEERLAPGIPFAHEDVEERWDAYALRELHVTEPPLAPGEDIERRPDVLQAHAFRPADADEVRVGVAGLGEPAPREVVARLVERLVDASPAAREALVDEMTRAPQPGGEMWSYQALTSLPLRAEALYRALVDEHGAPRTEDHGRAVHLVFPGASFRFNVPARIATFPNDSSGLTSTPMDDGLPYVKLYAMPEGDVALVHGEGNSRFDATEEELMRWANESFALAGLPAPTFERWHAEYATCM